MQKPGLFGMNGFMVFVLTCISVTARAQQPGNMILLEAENKKAFTVRMGDNFFASSSQGHLVLSHLKDSIYRLGIRFTNISLGEKVFPVTVHQKDLGLLLKGNDSVWVLYNWQTRETIQPVKEKDSSRILDQGVKRENGFSRLMAAVVNDSAVMYNTYSAGFGKDSAKAESLNPKAESSLVKDSLSSIGAPPTANRQPSTLVPSTTNHPPSSVSPPPSTVNHQPSTTLASPEMIAADKKARKDSLQAVKNSRDSLLVLAKAAKRDSLVASRKTRDSLLAARKLATQDSLQAARKSRDSLIAQGLKPKAESKNINEGITSSAAKPKTANGQPPTNLPPMASGQPSTDLPPTVLTSTANGQRPSNTSTQIKKLREIALKVSRKLVFLDKLGDGITDTITLFIYFETGELAANKSLPAGTATDLKKSGKPDSTEILSQAAARNKLAQKASAAGCGQLATDADMLFLRSAILRANTEQDKIALAASAFGQKCFAVDQIRILAALLVSDKARYRLMDAASLHIADPEHFHELANMYTDKNFRRKFLTLAGKHS